MKNEFGMEFSFDREVESDENVTIDTSMGFGHIVLSCVVGGLFGSCGLYPLIMFGGIGTKVLAYGLFGIVLIVASARSDRPGRLG